MHPIYDQFTVIIILAIAGQTIGIVVDSTSDLVTLFPEQIKPAPKMGIALNTDYLIELGTVDDHMIILIE